MRLIQLNIWGGKLQYQILDLIKKQQPDIICMQEVHDLQGPSGAVFVTLEEIKNNCDFNFSYMSPIYSSQYQQRPNSFGNATLSKIKINEEHTIFTYGEYKTNFDLTVDDFNSRNFQHVVLDSQPNLHVLNHHGYLLGDTKDGNQETHRQMKKISDYIKSLKGPVIFAGDLNLAPTTNSIKEIESVLTNLPVKFGINSTYSIFNNNNVVCDYIFVNSEVKVQDFQMSEELVSDHKALILEFDV